MAGEVREVETATSGLTVRELMESLDLDPERFIAVHEGSPLPEDSEARDGIELIRVVAGG